MRSPLFWRSSRLNRSTLFNSCFGQFLGAIACALILANAAFGEVLVNLDATGLTNGPLATWVNTGTISSNFTSAGTVVPQVTTVAGVKGVAFLGGTTGPNGTHYIGAVAPPSITGSSNRTIEAWVYNPSAQAEETVFAWGRRGGPDGSNVSFNHGTDGTFGAVGHWGAGPDIGWAGQMQFNRWTYLVYTYDGTAQTTTLYKDGQQANQESGIVLNTHTLSDAGAPLRFRVARQSAAGGGPSGVGVGEITIARIRVHDVALDGATVAATFETEKATFGLADADNDGLPDGYEGQYAGCLNATNAADASADCDSDGLTNLQEFQGGTVPTNADTDGDGANDGAEVNRMNGGVAAPTNPLRADTDGDNVLDGAETDTGTFVSATNTGTDPLLSDTDGDGFTDGHEVVRASNPTVNTSVPNLSVTNLAPLINLDATALPGGALAVWTNSGVLGGVFNASAAVPSVTTTQDAKGVTFNGTTHFYTGPGAPSFITGTNARTIEAWVYNPVAADEETIFSWARRGGPDGSNISFNHGLNATFGAVGHWGPPDVGWGTNPPAVSRWTFVAYTYDPTTSTATVYKDGAVANTDTATLNTHFADNTPAARPLPFRVASQNEADGTPTGTLRGSMTIARIRVYEVALDATTITNHFSAEADAFGLADNDGDGMPNGYERRFAFLNPDNPADAAMDQDNDGATNLEEYRATTAPNVADTDGDGVNDGTELHRMDGGSPAPTNPLRRDSDQDGLADNVETDTGTFASATNTGSDPLNSDSDADTFSDGQEVFHTSDPNLVASTPDFEFTAPVAIVNLDATDKPVGAFGTWTNSGALGGVFVSDAVGSVPQVEVVEGVKGVIFGGGADIYTGPVAPIFLTGGNSRTVEAWIYNPAAAAEETIFSWGRRGGPDGSNMSFNHGTDAAFGAVGHWGGGPDIGWAGNISTGRWTFVAATYDRATSTATVYRDGQQANTESGTTLNTHAVDNTPATNGLPFRVASQNEANGTATAGLRGSMTIARIRVYDEALPATGPDSIEAHYLAERGLFSGAALRLAIQFDRPASRATITWPASPGTRYTVESSSNLTSWSSRATGLTTGSFVDDQAGTNPLQFYRVRTE